MTQQQDLEGMMEDLAGRVESLHRARGGLPSSDLTTLEGLHTAMEELRAAQEELLATRAEAEAQRERYRDLFQFAPDGYLVTGPRGRITEANRAAARLLNVPEQFILGKPLLAYADRTDSMEMSRAIQAMRSCDRGEWMLRLCPRNSDPRVVHLTAAAVADAAGQVRSVRWLLRDVTEQQTAQRELRASRVQLQEMTSRLALVEEQERRRIATEIHDHISQSLAVAKLRLGMLRESCSGGTLTSIDEVRELLSRTLAQTRSLTFELSPTVLYELGLGSAIEWLIEQRGAYGIEFRLQNHAPGLRLRRDLEVTLFRGARELLANVIKHARATQCTVRLARDGGELTMQVEDNGIGFDPADQSARRARDASLGLFSVQERLEHLRGRVEIQTAPGAGTRVRLAVPLRLRKTRSSHLEKQDVTQRVDRGRSPDPPPGSSVAAGERTRSEGGGGGGRRAGRT